MIKVYYCERTPGKGGKEERISQHGLAYLLLERTLGENFPQMDVSGLVYGRSPQGKPFLRDYPQIQFNVSHCPCCVTCIVGDKPVGIDVERRFPWKDSFARRVCHPLELERLLELGQEERTLWLNRIWSRKESYLKYLGMGIRRDLRQFQVWDGELPGAGAREESREETWKESRGESWKRDRKESPAGMALPEILEGQMAPDGIACYFCELQTPSWTLAAWGREPVGAPIMKVIEGQGVEFLPESSGEV